MTEEEFRRAAAGPSSADESTEPQPQSSDPQSSEAPWLPADNSTNSTADQVPSVTNKRPVAPQLDNNRDDAWRTYDDEQYPTPPSDAPTDATRASYRYVPPKSNQQLIPFNRPIPDPDRAGSSWDFDDKLQLQPREPRSARAVKRWQAIPISHTSSSANTRSVPNRILSAPPLKPSTREEGGWRSSPR